MIKFFRKIRQKTLTENKFGKYITYGIGEIFLVVIGIYLAIQFNNWNVENQNKDIASNNIELLITSLEKDSIAFNQLQISIEKDKARLSNFGFRLSQPSSNLDTLIKIVRYDYKPFITGLNFDNDNTYDALVQSGEINLLNRELKNELFTLYSLHKSAEETNNTHFKLYLDWFTRLTSKYPANLATYGEGPISESIWKNATLIELANAFNPVIISKKNHYRLIGSDLNKLIIETNNVLGKLKGAIKVNE
jgi:hypothetical protein